MQKAIQISGYYDGGQIILKEQPPVQDKTEVMVYFLPKEASTSGSAGQKRIPGGLKGKLNIPNDFDEPLDDFKDYM